MGRYTLLGTVKDEGPYLLEWICHYKGIGFDNIAIASNDCSDGTHEMLAYLDSVGEIIHFDNSAHTKGDPADPQRRAYKKFWADERVHQSDWVLVADADEFLSINVGDGMLFDLFGALQDIHDRPVDLISATWRVFGNSGIVAFEDRPVTGQFTLAAQPGVSNIQRYTAFKTMFRPHVVEKLSIHRPRLDPQFIDETTPALWVNGSGIQMPSSYLKGGWRSFKNSYGIELVAMNHYMIKSSEAFLMKRYRGTANSADEDRIDFSYFDTFNANEVKETRITQNLTALEAMISNLKLRHPQLAKLHDQSLAWHRRELDHARVELVETRPDIASKLGII